MFQLKNLLFVNLLLILICGVSWSQDQDTDGIEDQTCVCVPNDNCQGVHNPDQGDCDSDSIGDACDNDPGCPDTDTDTDTDTGDPTDPYVRDNCRSIPDYVYSPITEGIEANILNIYASGVNPNEDVFMIVGDSIAGSGGISSYYMGNCAYPNGILEDVYGWIGIKDLRCFPDLQNTADFFTSDSYTRNSLAASAGQTADAVLAGDPSFLQQEIDALNPQYAVIMFGSNDIYGIESHETARIDQVVNNIIKVAHACAEQGVIPIILSSPTRSGYDDQLWILTEKLTYASEVYEYPFADFYAATWDLPNHGHGTDGQHPRYYGYNRMCVFTDEALDYGCNMHNLVTLQMLDNVLEIVTGD